jgi:hypothetical protein
VQGLVDDLPPSAREHPTRKALPTCLPNGYKNGFNHKGYRNLTKEALRNSLLRKALQRVADGTRTHNSQIHSLVR